MQAERVFNDLARVSTPFAKMEEEERAIEHEITEYVRVCSKGSEVPSQNCSTWNKRNKRWRKALRFTRLYKYRDLISLYEKVLLFPPRFFGLFSIFFEGERAMRRRFLQNGLQR